MTRSRELRLGTRASALALAQAQWVADALARAAGVSVSIVHLATEGDREQLVPVAAIGTKGVFTTRIQQALLEGTVDVAVHSLKDLPTEPVAGIIIACIPARESHRDALVSRDGKAHTELPKGASVATGSLRRRAQLLHARPDLVMRDVRGNVDTRLRKLAAGEFDALVLAEAGLRRLGLAQHVAESLDETIMLPAPGQGALAVECRASDRAIIEQVAMLDDSPTRAAVTAERALLSALEGGCLAPIGAWARIGKDRQLRLSGVVVAPNGSRRVYGELTGSRDQPSELGQRLADELLEQGALEIIRASRETP